MKNKLRINYVIVKPVLVWDDGDNLTPFEHEITSLQVPVTELKNLHETYKEEVKRIENQFNASEEEKQHSSEGE
ncbi:Uncharacterised protein [Mycobacteroides abscessus subsp. abscessus]|nr:Uncharacterised protein [Mycobacteroides abscessus subsp. abscessus]